MAEAGTLSGVVFDDPASADNSPFSTDGVGPGDRDGSAARVEGAGRPAESALEARLAEVERTNARHKEQLAGGAQEAQRLVEQNRILSQQNTDLLNTFRDLMKTPGTTVPAASAAADATSLPQRLNLSKALQKAVIEGDYSDWDKIDEGLPAMVAALSGRRAPDTESLRPEQVATLVRTELSKSTEAQQAYQRMVTSIAQSHPFLANPKDPLYLEAWQAYDEATKHPFMQEAYSDSNARFIVEMPAPPGQGFATKPMDMRVLDRVALEVSGRHARSQGRQQAEERQDAPTFDHGGREPRSARTPSMLFTQGEMANMQELLRNGIRGFSTIEAFRKHRWEKLMSPEEKTRRLTLWRAGKWE